MESIKLNEIQFQIIKKYCNNWRAINFINPSNDEDESINKPIPTDEKYYILIENFYQFFNLVTLRFNGIELFPEFENYKEAKTSIEMIKNINFRNVSKILTTKSKYENILGQDSVVVRIKPNLNNFELSTFEFSFWNMDYDISLSIRHFLELFIVILKNNVENLSYPNLSKEIKILEKIYVSLHQ
jgi:hypothetical protein